MKTLINEELNGLTGDDDRQDIKVCGVWRQVQVIKSNFRLTNTDARLQHHLNVL